MNGPAHVQIAAFVLLGTLVVVGILVFSFLGSRRAGNPFSYKDRTPQATLGCGTLILIAIIVAIFSQAGSDEIESEISELNTSIKTMQQTLESQGAELAEIRRLLEDNQNTGQVLDEPSPVELQPETPETPTSDSDESATEP